MADEVIKIDVDFEANQASADKIANSFGDKIASSIDSALSKVNIRDKIGNVFADATDKAIRQIPGIKTLFDNEMARDVFLGKGIDSPGEYAEYQRSKGHYAPSNAIGRTARAVSEYLDAIKMTEIKSSPEYRKIEADLNAVSHWASDMSRTATVQERFFTYANTARYAAQKAMDTSLPLEERSIYAKLAQSNVQSMSNRSYVSGHITDIEESAGYRVMSEQMRNDPSWYMTESERISLNQAKGEPVDEERASKLYKRIARDSKYYRDQAMSLQDFIDARQGTTGLHGANADYYLKQAYDSRLYHQFMISNLRKSERGQAMSLQDFINARLGIGDKAQESLSADFRAQELEEASKKHIETLKKTTSALSGFGKALNTATDIGVAVMKSNWGIASDLNDPMRTRRATRQAQAQQYGGMAAQYGVGMLSTAGAMAATGVGLPIAAGLAILGGALTVGGNVAKFLGARNESRREAAEAYTTGVIGYESHRLLYGNNVNYSAGQLAQLTGYTSAQSVRNLDVTAASIKGAMAFGGLGEQQSWALSMMPNYWQSLMDPNATTEDRLAAYAVDMNNLPEGYQAYINQLLPGGDESLRAFVKSGAFGEFMGSTGVAKNLDASLGAYAGEVNALTPKLGIQSMTEAVDNFNRSAPTAFNTQWSALDKQLFSGGEVPAIVNQILESASSKIKESVDAISTKNISITFNHNGGSETKTYASVNLSKNQSFIQ